MYGWGHLRMFPLPAERQGHTNKPSGPLEQQLLKMANVAEVEVDIAAGKGKEAMEQREIAVRAGSKQGCYGVR